MSDDTTNRGAQDRSRINLSQDYERHDWAKRLGVSEDELREAVRAVGDSADKVKDYLGHRKHASHPSRG
ncbi:MAG TPA: DUF3606 domain-containing protein [Casimicrobiaceae bacterium]|nr:DUF3606 domain-containing protein [Casimicrobiaceae bacterium]